MGRVFKLIIGSFLVFCTSLVGQNQPTGLAPNASLEPTHIHFEIFHETGNGFYDIEVDTTTAFNSVYYRKVDGTVDNSALSTGSTIIDSIANLYYGKKYYWRTRSRSATDTSKWSSINTFTTVDTALFLAPAPDSEVAPNSFSVWASHDRGNQEYIIEVSQNSGFTYPIYYRQTSLTFLLNPNLPHGTSFSTILNGMPSSGELFIRMIAKNDVDSSAWSKTVRVEIDEGLSANELMKDVVSVYPNPTNGILNIESHQAIEQLDVMDVSGKVVFTKSISNEKSVNLSALPNGFYMIRFQASGGLKYQKIRIVK